MTDHRYLAIYFRMGMYNEDDKVPSNLIGFDCPFDDSPVLYAKDEQELERKILEVCAGRYEPTESERDWDDVDWRGCYPDVICDNKGDIMVDLYRKITPYKKFHPDQDIYSFGRETLTEFWKRENWRWI